MNKPQHINPSSVHKNKKKQHKANDEKNSNYERRLKEQQIHITVGEKKYVFEQIKIVSVHAPLVNISIKKIDHSLFCPTLTGNRTVDTSILRFTRHEEGIVIISGMDHILEALERGEKSIMGRQVSAEALWRCEVPPEPPKKLSSDELKQALLTQAPVSVRVKPPVEEKKVDVVKTLTGQPATSQGKPQSTWSEKFGSIFGRKGNGAAA